MSMRPLALALLVLVLGCNRRTTVSAHGLGTGSISHGNTSAWFVIEEGKVSAVVWAEDIQNTSGSSGSTGVTGTLRRPDGSSLALDYHADDGTLAINGTQYKLADGCLFLVHSSESPPRVEQLRHGPLTTNDPAKAVLDLERDDPAVRSFTGPAVPASSPAVAATQPHR
jgi:hypothetical protein